MSIYHCLWLQLFPHLSAFPGASFIPRHNHIEIKPVKNPTAALSVHVKEESPSITLNQKLEPPSYEKSVS